MPRVERCLHVRVAQRRGDVGGAGGARQTGAHGREADPAHRRRIPQRRREGRARQHGAALAHARRPPLCRTGRQETQVGGQLRRPKGARKRDSVSLISSNESKEIARKNSHGN